MNVIRCPKCEVENGGSELVCKVCGAALTNSSDGVVRTVKQGEVMPAETFGSQMNPVVRRLALGLGLPIGGGGVLAYNLYSAHRSGPYYPVLVWFAPMLIALGLDALLFGFKPEDEHRETLLPRTQAFVGVGIAVGTLLVVLVQTGRI